MEKKYANRIIEYFLPYYPNNERKFSEIVFKALMQRKSYLEISELIKNIPNSISLSPIIIASTLLKSYGRYWLFEESKKANVLYFRYAGIIRQFNNKILSRSFCTKLLNASQEGIRWHINEINNMKNGQLEPVILFCGGWNCHHDWEPDPFYRR